MYEMTEQHLHNAFAGESQAHIRYRVYSKIAEEEGYQNVALLLRAIAFSEKVHASNHLESMPQRDGKFVGENPYGFGNTSENPQAGIDGETFEIEEMYPTYKKVADFHDENRAEKSFSWALKAEKVHKKMFEDAKNSVNDDEDIMLEKMSICSVCGYTIDGDPPENCPVCGAKGEKFEKFS